MSYELYCYQSKLGRPDLDEAISVLEAGDEDIVISGSKAVSEAIAEGLIDLNPKLERFRFDYEQIANLQNISIDDAKGKYQHIELNKPENDLAVQLTIFEGNVTISVPYWYTDKNARAVFQEVHEYTKVIRQIAGYFVYDPQTDKVYDPLTNDFDGLSVYEDTTSNLQQKLHSERQKPWWKFW